MPVTKKSSARKKNGQRNGQPDPRRIESLKQQFQLLRTYKARGEFLRRLPMGERREIIKDYYVSLQTDRTRDRFLNLLSLEESHALMWDLTYESHQSGRRLA